MSAGRIHDSWQDMPMPAMQWHNLHILLGESKNLKKKTDGEKKRFKVKNYLFDRIFSMLLQLSGDMNPILLSSTLYKRTETRKDEDWFKYIVHRIFTSLISLPFIDTSTQA